MGIHDLHGRIVVVTRADSTIGLGTALGLAGRGAGVAMACASPGGADAARRRVLAATGVNPGRVWARRVRLDDQAEVLGFAAEVLDRHDRLDVLINNPGRSGTGRALPGQLALTLRLLPALVSTLGSRVVTVTGLDRGRAAGRWLRACDPPGHRAGPGGRPTPTGVLFVLELARRLHAAGHRTLSLAADCGAAGLGGPGLVRGWFGGPGLARAWFGGPGLARAWARGTPGPFAAWRPGLPAGSRGACATLRAATDPAAASGHLYVAPPAGPAIGGAAGRRPEDACRARRLWQAALQSLPLDEPEQLIPLCRSTF